MAATGQGPRARGQGPGARGQATVNVSAKSSEFVIEQLPARILVCDDDGDVRSVVGALLRDLGHTVWEVSNPILALQILEREAPVDLLLVDYAMPEMNGRAVIERARVFQPGLKTLLMTGYAEALRNG